MTVTDLIKRAAAIVGNETKLAYACGVSQNAIWQAKKRGRVSGGLLLRRARRLLTTSARR
jgi:hypothetical protein